MDQSISEAAQITNIMVKVNPSQVFSYNRLGARSIFNPQLIPNVLPRCSSPSSAVAPPPELHIVVGFLLVKQA